MARTLAEIELSIKQQVKASSSLSSFKLVEDGGSKFSAFNTFITIMAGAIKTFEEIHDAFKADIQDLANAAIAGNTQWLQAKILEFQNGDAVTIDANYVPGYATIDLTKQIITRCAVVDGNPIEIKVAKGDVGSLAPLSAGELTALQDYYYGTSTSEGIGFAGIYAQFTSLLPDRMYIEADVYYQGQYGSATTKAAVIAAIDNYFETFQASNFNGVVRMEEVRDAIQSVPGVTRIDIQDVRVRDQATPFAAGRVLDVQGIYNTIAGYLISEDDPGNTLNDTITMNEETN